MARPTNIICDDMICTITIGADEIGANALRTRTHVSPAQPASNRRATSNGNDIER